jgi:hypothetical protein
MGLLLSGVIFAEDGVNEDWAEKVAAQEYQKLSIEAPNQVIPIKQRSMANWQK